MAAGYPAGPPGIAPAPPPGFATPPGAAVGEGQDISGSIISRVQRLIDEARKDTENKVKMELKHILQPMLAMDARLDQLIVQLDGVEAEKPHVRPTGEGSEPPLDAEVIAQLLSKIEQQWGQEIRTLKQELHQTILAHNHNADLIKHHKDTIDALRERCSMLQGSSVKTAEIQQQLQKLDARLKQQQKQRKLEPLFERLGVLEQRVATAAAAQHHGGAMAAAAAAAWRYPAGVPPRIGLPPGMDMPPVGHAKAAAVAKAALGEV